MEIRIINRFFFWFFVIVLAFMSYGIIMTFAILLLHYGVPYIKSELKDVCNNEPENSESMDEYSDVYPTKSMNFYNKKTHDDMK